MSESISTNRTASLRQDALALFVDKVEHAILQEDFEGAAELLEEDFGAAWFGMQPSRTLEILGAVVGNVSSQPSILHTVYSVLTADTAGQFDNQEYLATVDVDDPQQMFFLAMFRMGDFRMHGHTLEALEQGDTMEQYLGKMQPLVNAHRGFALQTFVQVGITAMLAGDFTRALTAFTQAQLHTPVPQYAFLTRDSLVKSALIHACFGNAATAKALLERAEKIRRTSSWTEDHIDAHRDFAKILTSTDSIVDALDELEAIDLNDIGELWPFYMVAIHRVLEAGGHHDELEHRLEMFDTMPFPSVDGDGFAGSIIPLKRAMLAMKAGRGTEAQTLSERTDKRLPYTQLVQAAAHIYAGRTQQAIQQALRLRSDTRGFRLMEVRRLSILASAQYQAVETKECLATLRQTTELPGGLRPHEMELFSPETRALASEHVSSWPTDTGGPSVFLTGLPKPGLALTAREVAIIEQVAKGKTRADIAKELFISVNTLKTQLKSVYRKLDVSSGPDAVLAAQRRGIL